MEGICNQAAAASFISLSVFTVHEETQKTIKEIYTLESTLKVFPPRTVIVRKHAGANESRVVWIEP